jgi:hypothetical protein
MENLEKDNEGLYFRYTKPQEILAIEQQAAESDKGW